MSAFTIEDLQEIAQEVIGDRDVTLSPEMTAMDVPGWDSLSHTLISIEIGGRTGRDIDAQSLAEAANFGELVDRVNALG
jgi:acyl carrier protein